LDAQGFSSEAQIHSEHASIATEPTIRHRPNNRRSLFPEVFTSIMLASGSATQLCSVIVGSNLNTAKVKSRLNMGHRKATLSVSSAREAHIYFLGRYIVVDVEMGFIRMLKHRFK
jgi:hypothetical protein